LREGDLSELFLVGDPINAQRAQAMGLLQRVVAHDELLDQARKMAESILAGGPETIRQTKKLLHHAYRHQAPPPDQFSQSIDEHLKARFSEEASEGLRAFLEKRPANWIIN
jgi:enoyl-CoA hydratase/carnithine racemase